MQADDITGTDSSSIRSDPMIFMKFSLQSSPVRVLYTVIVGIQHYAMAKESLQQRTRPCSNVNSGIGKVAMPWWNAVQIPVNARASEDEGRGGGRSTGTSPEQVLLPTRPPSKVQYCTELRLYGVGFSPPSPPLLY